MKLTWDDICKAIGAGGVIEEYPADEEIEELCEMALQEDLAALLRLLRYYRYLRVSVNEDECVKIRRMLETIFMCQKILKEGTDD